MAASSPRTTEWLSFAQTPGDRKKGIGVKMLEAQIYSLWLNIFFS